MHTVGQDCSVGKMVATLEITRALQSRGVDAKFIATGQTGIMVEGDGCPIDRVVADFVSGACLTIDGGWWLGKGLFGEGDVVAVKRRRPPESEPDSRP